jgi:diamine N-acetyltransferase
MEIREAGTEAIPVIRQIAHATWPATYGAILGKQQLDYMLGLIYSEQALHNQLVQLAHTFVIAYDEDEPVGFASFSPKVKAMHQTYRLHKLYVLPGRQGKGTGKFLLDHIIPRIKNAGASILELNVNRHNNARDFYKRAGFTVVQEEDIDIGNGYFMNDYIMQKEL